MYKSQQLTETEKAYIAGLFDGEGSVVIGVSTRKRLDGTTYPDHWLQIGITNTNRDILEWLLDKVGGHISTNSRTDHQKKCWAWRVMSKEAREFLVNILPYLHIKKKQAELGILFQDNKSYSADRKARMLTEEMLVFRENVRSEIRLLNSL